MPDPWASYGFGVFRAMDSVLRSRGPCAWGGVTLARRNRSDFCDLRLRCPSRPPEIARFPRQEKAMLHCDLRVRWKVASDLRFRAAISEPKTPFFCGISGDLAQSTRKSLAIAIVRFWCAKGVTLSQILKGETVRTPPRGSPANGLVSSLICSGFLQLWCLRFCLVLVCWTHVMVTCQGPAKIRTQSWGPCTIFWFMLGLQRGGGGWGSGEALGPLGAPLPHLGPQDWGVSHGPLRPH